MKTMTTWGLRLAIAAALLALAAGAEAHTRWRGGIWFGPVWPAVSLNFWVGGGPYYGSYYAPYVYPGVVYAPPVVVERYGVVVPPQASDKPEPVASARSAPDPIIYPRNGQSAEQTESDRRECNRWATTQREAMNDASVFKRAVEACMDGRGYTLR
jgi:hypothetical protein